MDVRSANALPDVFAQAAAQGGCSMVLLSFRNPILVTNDRRVVELCNKYRLPGIFDAREYVDAGSFMSSGRTSTPSTAS